MKIKGSGNVTSNRSEGVAP